MSVDLTLIGGKFLSGDCPDRPFLPHYFQGELPLAVAIYRRLFQPWAGSIRGLHRQFEDHTGMVCSAQRFQELAKRADRLEADYSQAVRSLDFDTVERIKAGKYKPSAPR